jgi:hypothetical protein
MLYVPVGTYYVGLLVPVLVDNLFFHDDLSPAWSLDPLCRREERISPIVLRSLQ